MRSLSTLLRPLQNLTAATVVAAALGASAMVAVEAPPA
jgi:hypothetical protein